MRIKSLLLKNVGPIRDLKINFRIQDGAQVPAILVGQNGTGKSLTLSTILDAMTEVRRGAFAVLSEVEANNYAKLSTKRYIKSGSNYSHAQVNFSIGPDEVQFNEIVRNSSAQNFQIEAPELGGIAAADPEFVRTGFFKGVNVAVQHRGIISTTNYAYFPHFRYEKSAWLAPSVKIDFASEERFIDHSNVNPIKTSIIDETRKWILNLLLDREIYERQLLPVPMNTTEGGVIELLVFNGHSGPNTLLYSMVGDVIKTMLQAKMPDVISARLGIGRKGRREISVFVTRQGHAEEMIAPDINMMSSGELMILSMIFEIIRSHEAVSGGIVENLAAVTGIVVIDEIDLHLHVSLQKTVLPQLIRQLPNVQFIVTTHSPYFVLGMHETGSVDIISLPLGNVIEAEDYNEFQETYEIFINKNQQFKARYDALTSKIAESTRPLIVTEGKTDWQHLKAALLKFKSSGQFSNLDIDFFEFDDSVDMGDSRLKQMCESMALIHRDRKMIFVFDRDNQKIISSMSGDPDRYKYFGNNVYSFCIPVPAHRIGYENISIELYYTDSDIATQEPSSGKRLWFTNNIRIHTEPNGGGSVFEAQPTANQATELKKKVYDDNIDKIVDANGNPVAISKAAFASQIVGVDAISANFDRTAFIAAFDVVAEIVSHTQP